VEGKIINLSVRGMAFLSKTATALEQRVSIAFKLPETSVTVHATGKVTNVTVVDGMTRAGVCFSAIPVGELAWLEQWMSEHTPQLPDLMAPRDDRGNKKMN
jgi:hypothetical protein